MAGGVAVGTATYIRLSTYYFLFYATVAVFSPYFNLYLYARGLSTAQIGLLSAIVPLVGVIVQPLWGIVNDRFHVQRWTLLAGLVVPSTILLLFPLFSSLSLYIVAVACMAMFQTTVVPVADSMTVQTIGTSRYGRVRLFGSLGYAIVVTIASTVIHVHGISQLPWLYAVVCWLTVLGVLQYPRPSRSPEIRQASVWDGTGKLLRNRRFVLVLCFTLLVTSSVAINNNFFSLYYYQLHRPMSLLGTIYAAGALTELPLFFLSGRLMERFGPERIFVFGSIVFSLRWLTLMFAPPTWVIILLQLTHGMSFGLTFAAGVTMAARVSEADNRVTAQTLYGAVNGGLSVILGSLSAGWLMSHIGPRGLYMGAAAFAVSGTVLMAWLVRRWPHARSTTALVHEG